MRMALIEMGHDQAPKPEATDSSAGEEFFNNVIRQQCSIEIDIKFYWVRDRLWQGNFLVYWMSGGNNLAEYFTKHHLTIHHRAQRSTYLVPIADTSKYA